MFMMMAMEVGPWGFFFLFFYSAWVAGGEKAAIKTVFFSSCENFLL